MTRTMILPVRVVLVGLGWCVGWCLCWRVREVPAAGGAHDGSTVSVVIPARDEEASLPVLLRRACRADARAGRHRRGGRSFERCDWRGRARGGARVLESGALPTGWTGKAWAMWQGATAATGDVVVFLDADVEPTPGLLERLVPCTIAAGGLVSVQPFHAVRRWWERASAFFNLVAVMGVGLASPRRPRRPSAFGPVMACRRDRYRELADHDSVPRRGARGRRARRAGSRPRASR